MIADLFGLLICLGIGFVGFVLAVITVIFGLYWAVTKSKSEEGKNTIKLDNQKEIK